jgi:hypothetical protein
MALLLKWQLNDSVGQQEQSYYGMALSIRTLGVDVVGLCLFQCMIWSWYLANDTQFYTLGILLLLLSSK